MSANPHAVTVTTLVEDEGTEDERRVVDRVTFTCTAPGNDDCRTYPDCDCESWTWNDARTHDQDGHERVPGQECWLAGWFDNEGAIYIGDNYDDMRDDCVPAISRSGPVKTSQGDECPEWEWDGEDPDNVALFDLVPTTEIGVK